MKNKFWKIQNKDEKTGEIVLYGLIESSTWWGDEITPKNFKKELDALGEVSAINVFINSDGGDCFAGQAIHSMLKRHKAHVNVYIDGLAASAASIVAMAGDTVYMPANAMMMIHNPWMIAMGYADDFIAAADMLEKVKESVIAAYVEKTGKTDKEISKLMDAETWMTAQDALDMGFADEIEQSKEVAACLDDGFLVLNGTKMDISRYKNTPKLGFLNSKAGKKSEEIDQKYVNMLDKFSNKGGKNNA